MSIQFENKAQAVASVVVVVAAVDQISSPEEQAFIFNKVCTMSVFSDHDEASFAALLGEVVEKMYSELPKAELFISGEALSILCVALCDVLDAEQRLEAYSMAVGLIKTDAATKEEIALLAGLQSGLALH